MADDFQITLHVNDRANSFYAGVFDAGGTGLSSGWHPTPEAALVALASKCREERNQLGAMPNKIVREEGKMEFFVWLARMFP